MGSLKEIRTRITSVTSTKQITSAMKMVSAAKFKKAQDAILRIRPYSSKLHEILSSISGSLESNTDNVYARSGITEKVLLVVITSNRGLCGAFNANVVKRANSLVEGKYAEQHKKGNVDFFTIGKNGTNQIAKKYKISEFNNELFNNLSFETVSPIASSIMQKFVDGKYDVIELIYNKFRNAAVQVLVNEQFLPIEMAENENADSNNDYIYEPSKEDIVHSLIPKSLRIQIYTALLDSHAAEHGARMTAMHKATDNATELIKDLKLHYNKARQASITNEILEIVGGAEALKG